MIGPKRRPYAAARGKPESIDTAWGVAQHMHACIVHDFPFTALQSGRACTTMPSDADPPIPNSIHVL